MRKSTTEDNPAVPCDKSNEQIDLAKAKLLSLREHVATVATSLIAAIENDGNGELEMAARNTSINC